MMNLSLPTVFHAMKNPHSPFFRVFALLCVLCGTLPAAAPPAVEATLVDADVFYGATFQSNNQKVVRNARGIFMAHLRSHNEKFTAQQWRLSWS